MELLDINEKLKNSSEQISEEQPDRFIEAVDSHKRIFMYGTMEN